MDLTTVHRAHEDFAALLTEAGASDLSRIGATGETGFEIYHRLVAGTRRLVAATTGRPAAVAGEGSEDPADLADEGDGRPVGELLATRFRILARQVEEALSREGAPPLHDEAEERLAEHLASVSTDTAALATVLGID